MASVDGAVKGDGGGGDCESGTVAVPRIYLLLENPSKSNNLGPILRCASAFGIVTVIAIGYEKCAVDGSHGASKHVQIIAFPTGKQAIEYLRHDCQCASIVGLMGPLPGGYDEAGATIHHFTDESSTGVTMMRGKNVVDRIDNTLDDNTQRRSYPVHAFSFTPGNICFVISKSRSGLPSSLFELCESYVHIPHSTTCAGDDWLLDTPSCLSILLHMYTNWANYDERTFQGHKFEVARRRPDEVTIDEDKQQHRSSARIAQLEKVETVVNATALGTFFGDESNSDY